MFIVLEGTDGSGTTTHVRRLEGHIVSMGRKVLSTREPTSGPIGVFIRKTIEQGLINPAALQLLFCADRAWHIGSDVLPALESGQIVVSDRYALSTLCYGEALGLNAQWLRRVNDEFIEPDVHILLLPPLSVSMDRVRSREGRDAFEEDSLQAKVHAAYTRSAAADKRIVVIDSSDAEDVVAARIFSVVDKALGQMSLSHLV